MSYADSDSVLAIQGLGKSERQEILKTFLESGMSGYASKAVVYIVFRFADTTLCYRSKNTPKNHAEINMLTFLRKSYPDDRLKSQRIIMYVSTSPCSFCSREIKTLAEDGVKVEIVMAGLHHINRASSPPFIPSYYIERNVQGLRDLQNVGVVVRSFNSQGKQDWNTLATHVLRVDGFKYKISDRKKEDERLKVDLQTVLEKGRSKKKFE